MGLVFFFLLLACLSNFLWSIIIDKKSRVQAIRDFKERPVESTFTITWLAFTLVFVIGVFVPPLGRIQFLSSDWEIWQIGGIGMFTFFAISMSPYSPIK